MDKELIANYSILLRLALLGERDLVNELLDYFLPGEIKNLVEAINLINDEILKK